MRLLVTGALGHIGSKLIRELAPDDLDEVILLDNLSTQRYSSLFGLPASVRYRFVEDDVCTGNLRSHFDGVDVVIHLAAITDAASSFDDPEKVERVNLEGTKRVAQACVDTSAKLIFPSTTSVYGTQEDEVDENCSHDQLKPQSPYAESKLSAEKLLQELGAAGKLDSCICRLGTIFGTSIGMRFHTAVNKFTWQACTGRPLTVWRTALNQKRPYLDLDDAVRAFRFVMHAGLFDGRVYNVVTTNATVADIVETIRMKIDDVCIEYVDSPIMNQLSYEVANARFRAAGFEFKGDLERGIFDTIDLLGAVGQRSALASK